MVWEEGKEGEERLMSGTVKQRKTGVGECYLEIRGGSPHPRGSLDLEYLCLLGQTMGQPLWLRWYS
jgi:hypothetical protein